MMPKSAWIFWACTLLTTGSVQAQNANNETLPRVMPDQEQHARDLQARYEHLLPANQFVLIAVGDSTMPALWIEESTAAP
ncbi:MAG: hypothetical protein WED11_01930, partial [Natronospirillum sp.]